MELWRLDLAINARGVAVDLDLVDGALYCSAVITEELVQEAKAITGLDNPGSVAQLSSWLEAETGEEVENLRKDTVSELIGSLSNDKAVRMLEIRQELSKTSVKKYDAMRAAVCDDGRIRGLLQFYGANRTGRWSGRLVQVQNLPRNYMDQLDLARILVIRKETDLIRCIFGSVPDTLSQLIRTAFIPSEGRKLMVADFSAIEARVIAWLAGEAWRQEVFATHGKIYEASASSMFGVPLERIKKGNPEYELRQKGKVAELALGYQGSTGALIAMGALNMGIPEAELPDIVLRWRSANRQIVSFWYTCEAAALELMRTGVPQGVSGCVFAREGNFLTIRLPSGRKLYYNAPVLRQNEKGKYQLYYRGVDQQSKTWGEIGTYGGKLVENIVQATARDCLAFALQNVSGAGYDIVMHVHDEIVADVPEDARLEDMVSVMSAPIPWADGLLLRADGFTAPYYKKD